MFKKLIYRATMLALLICAAPAPATTPKGNDTLQDLAECTYQTTPKSITYKADYSFGALTYHVQAVEYQAIFGATTATYNLTVYWGNNGLSGYTVTDKKTFDRYNLDLIKQRAQKYNIPDWLAEAKTRSHEKQHAEDHKKFHLLNFVGFENLNTDKTSILERRANISTVMEARALAAELKGMKQAINKHIAEVKQEITKIQAEPKKLQKLEKKLQVHLNAIKSGNTKKILSEKKLSDLVEDIQELQSHRADWDKNIAALNLKITEYNNLLQNAESLMLRMNENAIIKDSGTRYVDAYNKYIKQGDMENNKAFTAFVQSQTPALDAYFEECVKELKAKKAVSPYTANYSKLPKFMNSMDFEMTMLDNNARPVCRPCMWGDTLGKCKHCWCPNYGNVPSKYAKQPGDYIPQNYATLEPPNKN